MKRRAVFFDRDGVLNKIIMRGEKVASPRSVEELQVIDGAKELIRNVRSLGFLSIVVTNQPDVGRGLLSEAGLNSIHDELQRILAFDDLEVCTSGDDSDLRRKPNPGMLLDAAERHRIDLQESYFIGDTIKDMKAGKSAGVRTILVKTDYNLDALEFADHTCHSLDNILSIIAPSFTSEYLTHCSKLSSRIDVGAIERMVDVLLKTREKSGRLFLIGSGGGAGHASHATCDFRKLTGIESYCPTDNVSELTARINDEGWDTSLSNYLKGSRINENDCLFVFSVGGGNEEHNISMNLVQAIRTATETGASVLGVVGRDGGFLAKHATAHVVVPSISSELITPLTESFQAVLWHLIVSHPKLQQQKAKWESVA